VPTGAPAALHQQSSSQCGDEHAADISAKALLVQALVAAASGSGACSPGAPASASEFPKASRSSGASASKSGPLQQPEGQARVPAVTRIGAPGHRSVPEVAAARGPGAGPQGSVGQSSGERQQAAGEEASAPAAGPDAATDAVLVQLIGTSAGIKAAAAALMEQVEADTDNGPRRVVARIVERMDR
jgi:hypothetical protein